MKHNPGFSCVELAPGANTKVVPKEADPESPADFVDNTVYRYRMVNGEKILIDTMEPYPEGWDEIRKRPTVTGRKHEEDDSMVKYDWEILWPQVQELQAAGKTPKEIATELEIDLSVLNSKIYRETKAAEKQKSKNSKPTAPNQIIDWDTVWPKVEAILEQDPDRSPKAIADELGIPVNPLYPKIKYEREKKLKQQTPEPEPEKVGRQDPAQDTQEPAADSVPEGVPPVNMPIGCELPKKERISYTSTQYQEQIQASQYDPTDNDLIDEDLGPGFTVADDEPIPYRVVYDLAPVKIQLICTALAEYKDERIPADITLELVRAIGEIELVVR